MAFSLNAVTYTEVPTADIEKPEFEEPGITPQYTYTDNCATTLSISGGSASESITVYSAEKKV